MNLYIVSEFYTPPSEITPVLFIGNYLNGAELTLANPRGIQAVLNVSTDVEHHSPSSNSTWRIKRMSEMIKLRKAYKFRMEPTIREHDEMLRMAGTDRFVWNWALARCQTFYKENKKGISQSQLSKELTALKGQWPWLYDFDSQALQQVLKKLKQAYENHFNPKMKAGFPKFKTKKNARQSFRIPQRAVLKDGKVYVPKLGWVKVRQSQEIEGETKSAVFKCTATGKWFVTLTVEFEHIKCLPKVTSAQVVGGDVGLNTYLTLSDGSEPIPVPKFYRVYAKKLWRAQKTMCRRVKGSRNRAKARLLVSKVHERIVNLRSNFAHQLTHSLVSTHPALCLENLSIKGLAKTKLAKSMLDAAFGETVRQWKYKSLWNNCHAIQADRFFPSTQLCSECGYRNKALSLSDREWMCPACGTVHKRDFNASLNLKAEGIRQLDALGYMESLNDCGQCVSLAKVSNAG
jgi:putative transposase